jgi:hypothetical protein
LNASAVLTGVQPATTGTLAQPLAYFTGSQSNSSVSMTQQVFAQAEYGLKSYMSLRLYGGFGESRMPQMGFASQMWSAGASVSYNFWRNTSIVVSYGHMKAIALESAGLALLSNQQLGYEQNTVSAGLRYSY